MKNNDLKNCLEHLYAYGYCHAKKLNNGNKKLEIEQAYNYIISLFKQKSKKIEIDFVQKNTIADGSKGMQRG